MPEFIMPIGDRRADPPQFDELDPLHRGYVEAMFFTETGDADDGDLEDATFAELAPESLVRIMEDCDRFRRLAAPLLERAYERDYDEEQAGRDFWFTRNGHGVGFWDRDELTSDTLGDDLSAVACGFGGCDVYRGDDGRVYLS